MTSRTTTAFRTTRYALIAFAITAIACLGLIGIYAVFAEGLEETGTRFLMSLIIALLASVALLANTMTIEKKQYRTLGIAAAVFVFGAVGVWSIAIWRPWRYSTEFDEVVRLALTTTFVGVALTMYGQLLLLVTRFALLRAARHLVGLLCLGSAVMISGLVWEIVPIGSNAPSWQFVSLTLPLTIGAIVGLLTVPTVIRLVERRSVKSAETIPLRVSIQMSCPKCGVEQPLPNGPARCAACGWAMVIEIEEPRCECGYLLYRLSGDICPECGRDVPDDQRWLTGAAVEGGAPATSAG